MEDAQGDGLVQPEGEEGGECVGHFQGGHVMEPGEEVGADASVVGADFMCDVPFVVAVGGVVGECRVVDPEACVGEAGALEALHPSCDNAVEVGVAPHHVGGGVEGEGGVGVWFVLQVEHLQEGEVLGLQQQGEQGKEAECFCGLEGGSEGGEGEVEDPGE